MRTTSLGPDCADQFLLAFNPADLTEGVTFLDEGNIIAYKDAEGHITATRNRCKHRQGRFPTGQECLLTCPNHGWVLDLSTMAYKNPAGHLHQEQLIVKVDDNGIGEIFESTTPMPWEAGHRPEERLSESELTIRFYAHACVEISCGPSNLFTDPWLVGPAFSRGWWLVHRPPPDWLERLAAADAIYISHNHPDHLNLHTLKALASRNPNVNVIVPKFESDSCVQLARRTGLQNVNAVPFGVWTDLGPDSRFMILQDRSGRDDSGILVEYRGHRVLDTVDCSDLYDKGLPSPIDMLLSAFAGGATGYPVCWPEQYSEQEIDSMVSRNRVLMAEHLVEMAVQTKAKIVVPFAGYFSEAHPADEEIKSRNVKNSPGEIADRLKQVLPDTIVWLPAPGGEFDVGVFKPVDSSVTNNEAPVHDFDEYLGPIREDFNFEPLRHMEGIKKYFQWAGFFGDFVLHVVETDESFMTTEREFLVDFSDLSFLEARPDRPHRYLRMRVRADVFRHVLRWGLSWEEISIGFQARFYREPDVYNFDFWDHFQNKLPTSIPNFA